MTNSPTLSRSLLRGLGKLRRLLLLILILLGMIPNLYLSYHFICGDCVPIVAQFNHIPHFVLLAGIIGGGAVILLRGNWRQITWFMPSMVIFGLWFGGNWLPKSTPEVEGVEIKVATYNVLGFMADPEQTFAVIQDMDADLIGIQELRPILEGKLQTELREEYPYQVSQVIQGFEGLALLSRYPILESEISINPNYEDPATLLIPKYLRAVVQIEDQQVAVYVYHPATPLFSILTAYDDRAIHAQTRGIAALVARETMPVLILCDCNSTPRSRQYALLDDFLDNAFTDVGRGFGLTHPADWPIMRLDHVWFSEEFRAIEAEVIDEGGTSDHLPLWARLDLR